MYVCVYVFFMLNRDMYSLEFFITKRIGYFKIHHSLEKKNPTKKIWVSYRDITKQTRRCKMMNE